MAVDLGYAIGEGVEVGFKPINGLVMRVGTIVHADHHECDIGGKGSHAPVKGIEDAFAGIAIDSRVDNHVHFSIQLIADAFSEQFGVVASAPGIDHAMGDAVAVKEPADGLVVLEQCFDGVHGRT